MVSSDVASVKIYKDALEDLVLQAHAAKPGGGIEPALASSDFNGAVESLGRKPGSDFLTRPKSHYAAIETACRDIFYKLLVRGQSEHVTWRC